MLPIEKHLYFLGICLLAGCDKFGNYFTNSERTKFDQPYVYKHKVIVRNCHLTITGDDYTYVTVSINLGGAYKLVKIMPLGKGNK